MSETAYAAITDLACTVIDEDVANKLICRASLMVENLCGGEPKDTDAAKMVVCQMVERALSTSSDDYGTVDNGIQAISSYSNTWTWSNGIGDLYIKQSERKLLGVGGSIGFARPSYGILEPNDE